ncbi:MAG: Npt1/Npt2 family nucleotide transporter, partial [Thermodesulfobacteriota bacterium]
MEEKRGDHMVKGLGNWLKVYEDEIALFFWVVLLLFLIRTSSILFNNFAETAFLKRFGVEYLPIVQVINSFSTFFIMAFITGLMARIPGSRMLGYLLLFCGISVAALRLVVPLGFDLIYPLLYILKAQYEALLVLVFWNLANDLFNTRQSKRLFPLITAGGVVGGIVGSFATPPLAKFISMDNLMVAYLMTTCVGAVVVKIMGIRFPALLVKEPSKKKKQAKKGTPFVQEFKDILPLVKQSTLVKILILLTLLPNVVIPIINYQFSYAVNDSFATQGGMLNFFGYFRGAMNIVSLFILLFVGRVYGKWGLPVVLMFHPVNYMIAFAAFLLRFDIFSAMYARISTNVIRTTMNNPARAVLMGLFPVEYRAVIRPFLRGTVVRIGILAGSGIIIASEGWFHPRYLSIAAMMFVGAWILTDLWLKKSYSNILLDLITRNILDLKTLEEKDLGSVFADKTIQSR